VNILTARSKDAKYAFTSRMFAVRSGVPEDPVCGTAHILLGPYWAMKDGLEAKLDGEGILARQVSWRGGDVRVSRGEGSIKLAGKVVTLARGNVYV
jgi:predicted PhzF superfamily epimerase YddE/YHI9